MTDPAPRQAYLRRRGRLTTAQARALERFTHRYLVDLPDAGLARRASDRQVKDTLTASKLDSSDTVSRRSRNLEASFWRDKFGRSAPLAIEACFGNGVALAALATSHPDWNCVGVDVYRPGFGALMLACERHDVDNVRIVEGEVLTFLRGLQGASVHRLHVFFPDPWPKKRHHKRRLVNDAFARAAANCLEPDGALCLATDWEEYAEQMIEVLGAEPGLAGGVAARAERPLTPFEAKGLASGRRVVDLAYRRVADQRN